MLHAFYRWLWYRLHGQICVITSLGLVSRGKVWVVKVMNILRPQSPCKHSFEGDAFSFFVILVCPLALISVFQRIYIKQFFILFAVIIRFEHSKNVSRSKKYHPLNNHPHYRISKHWIKMGLTFDLASNTFLG